MAQRHPLPSTTLRRLLHRSTPRLSSRPFHTSFALAGSSFFDLTRLSASRESQHLSKEKGRPRTDFASHLELIKSSEVTPFATKSDVVEKTTGQGHGQTDTKATHEKAIPKYGLTQEVIDRCMREQRVYGYLVNEVVRLETAIKDLNKPGQEADDTNTAPVSRKAGQEHVSSEEIDKAAAESPIVAYMKKRIIHSSAILQEALQAKSSMSTDGATRGGPMSKSQVDDTTRKDRLIASLLEELEASKTEAKKVPVDRIVKQPQNPSDRIAIVLGLLSLSGLAWMTGRLWTLSAERKKMLARRQQEPPTPILAIPQDFIESPTQKGDQSSDADTTFRDGDGESSRMALSSRLKRWFWAS
ncbi:MAG: hypothetical protein Q9169_007522 [Polycauliona sp. 2 TL-2023]